MALTRIYQFKADFQAPDGFTFEKANTTVNLFGGGQFVDIPRTVTGAGIVEGEPQYVGEAQFSVMYKDREVHKDIISAAINAEGITLAQLYDLLKQKTVTVDGNSVPMFTNIEDTNYPPFGDGVTVENAQNHYENVAETIDSGGSVIYNLSVGRASGVVSCKLTRNGSILFQTSYEDAQKYILNVNEFITSTNSDGSINIIPNDFVEIADDNIFYVTGNKAMQAALTVNVLPLADDFDETVVANFVIDFPDGGTVEYRNYVFYAVRKS